MKRYGLAVGAGLLALAPAAGLAAIDNSHHDMTAFLTASTKCAYCHSVTNLTTAYTGYGNVGTFCIAVCHTGLTSGLGGATPGGPGYFGTTGTAGRYTTTAGVTAINVVAFTASHGNNPTILTAPDQPGDVAATNWPHSGETNMQCTTCHAVHDAANPPFLNAPLSGASNAESFCQRCHTGNGAGAAAGRFADITGFGAHPAEFDFTRAGVGPASEPTKLARALEIKTDVLATPLKSDYADIAAFNADISQNAWRTGGHFVVPGTPAPGTKAGLPFFGGATAVNAVAATGIARFGCYTCHSAHQDANGGVVAGLQPWLGLAQLEYTLDAGQSSNYCTGCHGNRAATTGANVNNPGGTAYWHPTNEETAWNAGSTVSDATVYTHDHSVHASVTDPNIPATGSFPIVVDINSTTLPATSLGSTGEIYCTACHDVHGGVAGQMAIRLIDATVQPAKAVCLACHKDATGSQTANNNWHHPGSATAPAGFPTTVGWTNPADGLGDLSDGLSCPDCHVFQSSATHRATAHNW